jgi:hypothetical protein
MARVLTYTLEFRGEATQDGSGFVKRASATPCSHVTRLGERGVDARLVYDDGGEEAFLEGRLSMNGDGSFTETSAVYFGHGHELHLRTVDPGRLAPSADDDLSHGTAVLEVVRGTGQFAGATGRITANFVLSDTGDLTETQLGLVFAGREI